MTNPRCHLTELHLLACVASVFNRVIGRKLEWKQKKWKIEGEGEGEGGVYYSPLPLHSSNLHSSELSRQTRVETFASTQANCFLEMLLPRE